MAGVGGFQTAAHITLGIALASYSAWLADPEAEQAAHLDEALSGLREYLST